MCCLFVLFCCDLFILLFLHPCNFLESVILDFISVSLRCYIFRLDEVKGLKIIHLNIISLVCKIDLLRVWVDLNKPDIVTLSESVTEA